MKEYAMYIKQPLLMVSLAACSLSSCATSIWPLGDNRSQDVVAESNETQSNGPGKIKSRNFKSEQEIELKQARMWNRLDELEDEVKSQRERIKLLEQGLLTGIAPEELKKPVKQKSKAYALKPTEEVPRVEKQHDETETGLSPPVLDDAEKLASKAAAAPSVGSSPDSYRVKLQVAKDYYQASRFGLAVAELAQISRDFGPTVGDGESQYLLGRSYLGLKEYTTARAELETFISKYPQSESIPLARIDLARSLLGMNLRDRARKELTQVAKEYEGQDAGDIAAAELRNMKGSL